MVFEILKKILIKLGKWLKNKILYLIDNCWIVEGDSTGITIKIDLFDYRKLLEDLTNYFFTKKISTRKKIEHAYFVGNPFLTIKGYNGFR